MKSKTKLWWWPKRRVAAGYRYPLGIKMNSEVIENAINNLWFKRAYQHEKEKIITACLLRTEDWRPLNANWWKGKEVCIIGADINGNFILRHCDGSVRHWNHASQSEVIISSSVIGFASNLIEENA